MSEGIAYVNSAFRRLLALKWFGLCT